MGRNIVRINLGFTSSPSVNATYPTAAACGFSPPIRPRIGSARATHAPPNALASWKMPMMAPSLKLDPHMMAISKWHEANTVRQTWMNHDLSTSTIWTIWNKEGRLNKINITDEKPPPKIRKISEKDSRKLTDLSASTQQLNGIPTALLQAPVHICQLHRQMQPLPRRQILLDQLLAGRHNKLWQTGCFCCGVWDIEYYYHYYYYHSKLSLLLLLMLINIYVYIYLKKHYYHYRWSLLLLLIYIYI